MNWIDSCNELELLFKLGKKYPTLTYSGDAMNEIGLKFIIWTGPSIIYGL